LTGNWSVQSSWAARRLLGRRLHEKPADAVFIHTQIAALFVKSIMRRVPTVVSLDATPIDFDTVADAYGHARQSGPVEQAKLWINRRALAAAAGIVTWSDWTARSVISDYQVPAELVHPIYPGVELQRFQPTDRYRPPGPLKVLFVGGDFTRKGGEDLLDAIASLGSQVELDVVTSTQDIDVPDVSNIRIHRSVPPKSEQLRSLYAGADIFALPTRGDCTPLVIAEAMACGLPIVATTVGSIPDMVSHGHNGLLVRPRRPDELAQVIRTLASDQALRARMGAASRVLAEEEHDTTKNCLRIFDLMRELSRSNPLEAARR
jgi:glycosyltransferase involved in cell wall biosynthesis